MAASLRSAITGSARLLRSKSQLTCPVPRRFILSEAYSCSEAWKKQITDPIVTQMSMTDFAFQVRDEFERTGRVSSVDMNILSHLLSQMEEGDEDEAEYMVDLLHKFNKCNDSLPRKDSTSHAALRNFLSTGNSNRVPELLTDRLNFGLLPNHYTLNYILNYFITRKQVAEAAQVAYCSTIQEDFSSPVNTWLCLHACLQRLLTSQVDDLAPPPPEASDGEEDWIVVPYIKYPYYDDHLDITDERFLLGKSLVLLSHADSVQLPTQVRSSLRVIGCGLWHKFQRGITALQEISESPDGKITDVALEYFSESLTKVEARDPNEAEVEIALRRVEHEMRKLLPTFHEKEDLVAEFSRLRETLQGQGRVVPGADLGQTVLDLAIKGVKVHEAEDISQQEALFESWMIERRQELEEQVQMLQRNERVEEMKKQVKELQEREELLTYFDFEDNVRLKFLQDDTSDSDRKLIISKDLK